MKILKITKVKKILLLMGLTTIMILLFNTKAFAMHAIDLPIEAYVGNNGRWSIYDLPSHWSCESSNTNVVKVRKLNPYSNTVVYEPIKPGNATISVNAISPIGLIITETISREITVKQRQSDLTIERDPKFTYDGREEIIVGFSRTWTVKSPWGWTVYSKPNKTISVNNITENRKNNKINFTAIGPGETEIKITENYKGAPTTTVYIRVLAYPTSLTINNIPKNVRMGITYKLTATTQPANIVGKRGYGTIYWTSSNTEIATVNRNDGTVYFKKTDTNNRFVVITVHYETDNNHPKIYRCVTFSNIERPYSDLRVPAKRSIEIFSGRQHKIDITSSFQWFYKVINPDVIEINSAITASGLTFTAKKPGWAGIKVHQKYYDNCIYYFTIKVLENVEDIQFINAPTSVSIGDSFKLTAKTFPYNYVENGSRIKKGYGTLTWKSTNENAATVDKNGNVKIKGYGPTEIRAIYSGNVLKKDFYAYFSFNIQAPSGTNPGGGGSTPNMQLKYKSGSVSEGEFNSNYIIDTDSFKITGQHKYNLTYEEKSFLAYVATSENGYDTDAIRIEVSLMANCTERETDGFDVVGYITKDIRQFQRLSSITFLCWSI